MLGHPSGKQTSAIIGEAQAMARLESREYKVMLDHRLFVDRKTALKELWHDLRRLADVEGVMSDDRFDCVEKRTIRFVDSSDSVLRRNGLILRHRQAADGGDFEFTLKCRSPDRYQAEAKDLRAAKGVKGKLKFEEDIAAPFTSRFSRSLTIPAKGDRLPKSLADAARLFPNVGEVESGGRKCDGKTPLEIVGRFTAHERVYKGPRLDLAEKFESTVAVILWSGTWPGRVVAAELSFRYGHKREEYPLATVEQAYRLFADVQRLDWCLPGGTTKTQFAYGD